MGTADAVPGISGGTVALVLGVYDELVTALSSCDRTWFHLVRQGAWRAAAERIHLLFLLRLATGIAVGLITALLTVSYLLEHDHTRPFTMAVFFGVIFSSTLLVKRMIECRSTQASVISAGLILLGAVFSFCLTPSHPMQPSNPSLIYLFACGAIAICAMVLPGISGAMVLLILGAYDHLARLPRLLLQGDRIASVLVEILVFGSGCLIGLLGFSRLLRYLLSTYRPFTISLLCGAMFGGLNKLWPFQEQLETAKETEPRYKNVLPANFDLETGAVLLTVLVSALLVFWIDRQSQKGRRQKKTAEEKTSPA